MLTHAFLAGRLLEDIVITAHYFSSCAYIVHGRSTHSFHERIIPRGTYRFESTLNRENIIFFFIALDALALSRVDAEIWQFCMDDK